MFSSISCRFVLNFRNSVCLRKRIGLGFSVKTNKFIGTFQRSAPYSKNAYNYNPKDKRSTMYYLAAAGVFACGMSYAAVPLYRIFCQVFILVLRLSK